MQGGDIMTEDQKKIKKYVNQLERRLKLPLKIKARINGDIGTEIHERLEAGQTGDEALAEMGSPDELAEQFNRDFADYVGKKNPMRFVFLAAAALILTGAVYYGISILQMQRDIAAASADVIGGAAASTEIYILSDEASPNSFGYWCSAAGLFLGCIAAYFLILSGKGVRKEKYTKCILLSGAGLILNVIVPFMQPEAPAILEWSFLVGITEITAAPGIILNLIVLVLALKYQRNARQ